MGSTIKNLKINLKLYLLAGIAILGMFLVGFISIALMGTLNHSALIIADKWMPSLYLSGEMETTLTAVRLNEQVLVMASTAEDCTRLCKMHGQSIRRWTANLPV